MIEGILAKLLERGLSWIGSLVLSWFRLEGKIKKIKSKVRKESDRVDVVRAKIKALRAAKKPIPEKLHRELEDATYILNSNFY